MLKKRFGSIVGGAIFAILAVGFFMQRGETAAPRNLVPSLPDPIRQTVLKPAVSPAPAPLVTADVATPADMQNLVLASSVAPLIIPPSLPERGPRALNTASASADGENIPADPAMPNLGCEVTARATPAPMAMVDLRVSAPCFPNERVTVHHNGMMFTQSTDTAGNLAVSVPALSREAVFIVVFADGKGAVATAQVPDLDRFDRVAVQWTGNAGFQIHAREFGAPYGGPGHVWSGAPEGDGRNRGMVVRLGDADTLTPQMAEVYTFPTAGSAKSGTVTLSVEAEVTEQNCGRDVSAQSLELRGRAALRTRDLVLAMPDCSELGGFLVLNNLVDDLTIAAR